MAFIRPTLAEIADRVRQDFVSRLSLSGAVLRRSVVFVLSMVIAGAAHMLHGHLDFLADQLFADTAQESFLVRLARLFGLDRLAPTFAVGLVEITGTTGTVVPISTVLVRSDGVTFTTDAEVTLVMGAAVVSVTAVEAAEAGNTDPGVVLTLESPIAGADAVTVEVDGLIDGSDEELIETLRVRLIARMRAPPHGGNAADYVAWALEVAGVTRAWVYPRAYGAGTVLVIFVRDDDGDFIPSGGEVTSVQEHIDEVRPVTATVTVLAPIGDALDPEIHIEPDNSETRAAVTAELQDMLRRDAEPGDAEDAAVGTILLSHIELAIGIADQVTDFTLIDPVANRTVAPTHIVKLGTITWS